MLGHERGETGVHTFTFQSDNILEGTKANIVEIMGPKCSN